MRRPDGAMAVRLLIVVCLVTGAVGSAAAVGDIGDAGPFQTGEVEPDGVVLRADVTEDGSAAWAIEYRVRLDDENTTAAFEDFAADLRANRSTYEGQFADRMDRTATAAENATGRTMRIENVSVAAERRQLPQEYGVVVYRFRWTGFAAVDGDRLRVGDALSGLFLDSETRLILAWPEGYEATSVTPDPDERDGTRVVWRGPVDFASDEPRVELAAGGGFPVALAGAVVLALLLVAGLLLYRRRDAAEEGAAAQDGAAVEEGTTAAEGPAAEESTEAAGTDESAGQPADAGGAATADEPAEPDEELLSPEERVLAFVEERGGRVKQQEVVSSFDWSAARTSQVVGNLRDDGELETFRLGRENVLTLPDDDDDDEEFGDPAPEP